MRASMCHVEVSASDYAYRVTATMAGIRTTEAWSMARRMVTHKSETAGLTPDGDTHLAPLDTPTLA